MEDKKNIGGIWEGETKAGKPKLTIKVDEDLKAGVYYTALENNFKTEDKHPSYRIMPQNDLPPNPV